MRQPSIAFLRKKESSRVRACLICEPIYCAPQLMPCISLAHLAYLKACSLKFIRMQTHHENESREGRTRYTHCSAILVSKCVQEPGINTLGHHKLHRAQTNSAEIIHTTHASSNSLVTSKLGAESTNFWERHFGRRERESVCVYIYIYIYIYTYIQTCSGCFLSAAPPERLSAVAFCSLQSTSIETSKKAAGATDAMSSSPLSLAPLRTTQVAKYLLNHARM
jgi:hypothetical protein